MRYEIGDKKFFAVVDDSGVRITIDLPGRRKNIFLPYSKIVAVSVKKPGVIIAGNIFFQTAADRVNSVTSDNIVPFKGKEQYEIACEIQEAIEKLI